MRIAVVLWVLLVVSAASLPALARPAQQPASQTPKLVKPVAKTVVRPVVARPLHVVSTPKTVRVIRSTSGLRTLAGELGHPRTSLPAPRGLGQQPLRLPAPRGISSSRARLQPTVVPHALRTLGLQLELQLMKESLQ